ncbi:MAG: amidase domain-containing protein [Candidatus Aminicenantales bacterium]
MNNNKIKILILIFCLFLGLLQTNTKLYSGQTVLAGEAEFPKEYYDKWLAAQRDPSLNEEAKVKSTIDTYFILKYESWKTGKLLDFGFLFDLENTKAFEDYAYERGILLCFIAGQRYFKSLLIRYDYKPTYLKANIDERIANVLIRPTAEIVQADTNGTIDTTPWTDHNLSLIILDGTWLIRSLFTDDEIHDTMPRGTDFDTRARTLPARNKALEEENKKNNEKGIPQDVLKINNVDWQFINFDWSGRMRCRNYAERYSIDDGSTGHESYNPRFIAYENDCQNFVSQCLWAGFNGIDDVAHIESHEYPMIESNMDAITWWCDSSNSGTWQYLGSTWYPWVNVADFSRMIIRNRENQWQGLHGWGYQVGFDYYSIGDVVITKTGSHAMIISDIIDYNGDGSPQFNELYVCGHTNNRCNKRLNELSDDSLSFYYRRISGFRRQTAPSDPDDDDDGVKTIYEHPDPNKDGDYADAQDTDNDSTPDYLDSDDDGDGILTIYESADPNGDGNPSDARNSDAIVAGSKIKIANLDKTDYLDNDDDGDGLLTINENPDPNNDGNPSDAIDSDNNGIPDYLDPVKPLIGLDRQRLNFQGILSGETTSSQPFRIYNSGTGNLNWIVSDNQGWLSCSPSYGTNYGVVDVSVNTAGLAPGQTLTGTIRIEAPYTLNSPQFITVNLKVISSSQSAPPIGVLDIPDESTTKYGEIAVCGWALDDIEVNKVEVKRLPYAGDPQEAIGSDGLVYIGKGVFVEGARPDVENYFPDYPFCHRAGWGYMLLTYGLPNRGFNNTFTIVAVAFDKEGKRAEIGRKTIYCNNQNNVSPFGTIDTPGQGGSINGSSYPNFGWVLTEPPDWIPYDGSTLQVYIDSVPVGQPLYNLFRQDIYDAFPGYLNRNGAVGVYFVDSTQYQNGMHNIGWSATDSNGNTNGIGSRFFLVENGQGALALSDNSMKDGYRNTSPVYSSLSLNNQGAGSQDDKETVLVEFGFSSEKSYKQYAPNDKGNINISMNTKDRVVIHLDPNTAKTEQASSDNYQGYLVNGGFLHNLPIGSTFDAKKGDFYWWPGPGFYGDYEFLFINKRKGNTKKNIFIRIGKKPLIH